MLKLPVCHRINSRALPIAGPIVRDDQRVVEPACEVSRGGMTKVMIEEYQRRSDVELATEHLIMMPWPRARRRHFETVVRPTRHRRIARDRGNGVPQRQIQVTETALLRTKVVRERNRVRPPEKMLGCDCYAIDLTWT